MEQYLPLQPTFLSVTCFLRNGDDILLMHRAPDRKHEPNSYCGVGGKVHSGETFLDTAVREVKEETGLEIDQADFIYRGQLIMEGYPERWMVTLLEATTNTRTVVADPREGTLEWVPQDKVLDTNLMDDIRFYYPIYAASSAPIYGYFLFDANNKVISHRIQQ